jgi:chaperonin GroES
MPNIKPLNDKVLIERLESSAKTPGGILLPDSAKEKPTEGRVVAAGDGAWNDQGQRVPLSVKVGDRILFSTYAGTTIKEMGKEYLILDESEILAVVDEKPFSGAAAEKSSKPVPKKAGR